MQFVPDANFPRSERIKEEEEFSYGRASVEVVKGFFEAVQLRQRVNQLEDVIFEVVFA